MLVACGGEDDGDSGGEETSEPVTLETVQSNLEGADLKVRESNDPPITFFSYLGRFEPQSTLEVSSPELEGIAQVYEFADESEAASAVDRFTYGETPAAQLGTVMISAAEADQETVVEAAGGESPASQPTDLEEIRAGLSEAGFEVTEPGLPNGAEKEGVEAMLELSGPELDGETLIFGFDSEESMLDAAVQLFNQELYPALLGPNLVYSEKSENVAAVVEAVSE